VYKIKEIYTIIIPINEVSHFEYLAEKEKIEITDKVFGEKVVFKIRIENEKKNSLLSAVTKINGILTSPED